jgi:hypothetical protein
MFSKHPKLWQSSLATQALMLELELKYEAMKIEYKILKVEYQAFSPTSTLLLVSCSEMSALVSSSALVVAPVSV